MKIYPVEAGLFQCR